MAEVPVTKVRWIKAINTHKLGDIEDVSTARVKNLLNAELIELYPPKAKPPTKTVKVERAVVEPVEEAAEVAPKQAEKPKPQRLRK